MSEHERRMAAARWAYDTGFNPSLETRLSSAIHAYNAPLPPEPVPVTDEMLNAARTAYAPNPTSLPYMRRAIDAAMRESPVVKAAQAWRDGLSAISLSPRASALRKALEEAGL